MLKDARLITMYKTAKENVAITYNKQETYKPPLKKLNSKNNEIIIHKTFEIFNTKKEPFTFFFNI
jgi:hypothetical protein